MASRSLVLWGLLGAALVPAACSPSDTKLSRALAAMMLSRSVEEVPFYRALCNQAILTEVDVHEFGLWTKVK